MGMLLFVSFFLWGDCTLPGSTGGSERWPARPVCVCLGGGGGRDIGGEVFVILGFDKGGDSGGVGSNIGGGVCCVWLTVILVIVIVMLVLFKPRKW